jgi:hypothetical protein
MTFKITIKKVFISLVPFYLMIFLIPFIFKYEGLDAWVGSSLFGVMIMVYWLFIVMAYPFHSIFLKVGLMEGLVGFPEISNTGLFLLAFIYSVLIYILISIFYKKKK